MLKRLILRLKKLFSSSSNSAGVKYKSEDEYYDYLFTKSGFYSSKDLNSEEEVRWKNINKLINSALEHNGTKKFDRIVDYGCGRGWLSNELSKYGKVIGIEPVKSVVEYGRILFPGLDLRNGKIDILKGLNVDLIVSSEVIEHIPRNEQHMYFSAFRESLVNDKGYLIITTPRSECFGEWSKFLDPSQPVEDWLSEDEVRSYAESAGFTVIEKITYSDRPSADAELLEVYQQWLFKA